MYTLTLIPWHLNSIHPMCICHRWDNQSDELSNEACTDILHELSAICYCFYQPYRTHETP